MELAGWHGPGWVDVARTDFIPVLECEITEGAPSGTPSYIALLFRLPFPFEWASPFEIHNQKVVV